MGNYMETLLSEEQLAAYLDGMLSTAECCAVEDMIANDTMLTDITDCIDDVDMILVNDDEEIPLECMADDFVLPDIIDDTFETDEEQDGSVESDSEDMYDSEETQQDDTLLDEEAFDDDFC